MTESAEDKDKTKSSFVKVGKKYRPKFRENALLTTWHLNYFKPIEVPKDILLRNGVLDEIITVNPLTGVVEVITTFMLSRSCKKTKYKKPYRIWTLNEPARKALNRHMDINIGSRLYSKELPATNADTSIKDIETNSLLIKPGNNYSIFYFGAEIPKCINDTHIDQFIDGILVKNITLKEPGSYGAGKAEVLDFQSKDNAILANRDIRLNDPDTDLTDNQLYFDDKKLYINIGLQKYDESNYAYIVKVKYCFKPKTDDLVEYYEKLKSGELYNKLLSPDIYVDDLLSDKLYDPVFLETLNGGADKYTEFKDTRYGISIGDDNTVIKPVSLLTWIPPVKPIPDPYFQYRLSSMYTMNGFNWLRSSLFDTRVYSDKGNYITDSDRDWLGYYPNYYSTSFLNIINNNNIDKKSNSLNLFFTDTRREDNNYNHYYPGNRGIDPYNRVSDYTTIPSSEMNSSEYINDGYFYKDAIPNYDDISSDDKYHLFGSLGDMGFSPGPNIGYGISEYVHQKHYPNVSLDTDGRNQLLYGNFNEGMMDYSRLVFRGGAWILNNLFVTEPLVTGNAEINLTPINKFIINYYNERKLSGLKPFSDNESVVRGLKLSDGIATETVIEDTAFDEEIPSVKTNTYTFPLSSLINEFNSLPSMPSEGWLRNGIQTDDYSTSNQMYNPYHAAMEQVDKLEPILSAEDLNEGKFKLHRYLNIDNPENTESNDDLNRKYVRHMVYRPDNEVIENNKKIGLYNFEDGNTLREQLEMGTYRYGQFVYSDPTPIDLSEIFPDNKRENVLESETISEHNFLFNIPLGSSNYMGDRLLKDKVPIDRRDNRPKDFADFPFNRMLPKMLNTYDAVDKSWFMVWTSGYIQETSIKDVYYKNNGDNYGNVNKVLLTSFHHRGIAPDINLHRAIRYLIDGNYDDSYTPLRNDVANHVFLYNILVNTSYEPDYNLFNGLTGIAERMSLVYSLSPEKLLSDDRYWNNSYTRYGKIGPDEEHKNYDGKDTGLSNKDSNSLTETLASALKHPVYLYVLGGYETLYNRYHEYKMYRALRYGEKTQEEYEYTVDKDELSKHGHLLFSAPLQLQTATAFALATGINSYFYTPTPACGLLDYYKKNADGSGHGNKYDTYIYDINYIKDDMLLKYTPTLPTYLSGLSPLYQIFNLKNTLGNYTKFKEFSNKGLDLFMDRMESLEAIKNVVSYKPVNYHHLITDESYPEVARCLTAFLLADWCNIKITDGAGNTHEYKRINNFMVKYDINGDDITVNNRPIVEDIGTKGTSMRHIITDVWGKRPEDVYNDEVIDIRKLHGGLGFSISGISKRTRLIDNIDSIERLFSYMNFCTPCLPFGGDTFELAYVTENYNTVRLDYVDDIYKQDGIYNRSCFEHYSPNCFARNKELTENDPDNEKYKAYIDHLAQLNKLMLGGMTTIYDIKDDRVYKDSIYKNIVIDSEETPFLDMGYQPARRTNSSPDNKWYSAGGDNASIVLEFHFNPIFGVPGDKVSFEAGGNSGSNMYMSRLDGFNRLDYDL